MLSPFFFFFGVKDDDENGDDDDDDHENCDNDEDKESEVNDDNNENGGIDDNGVGVTCVHPAFSFSWDISAFSLSRLFCFRRWRRSNARGCLLQSGFSH